MNEDGQTMSVERISYNIAYFILPELASGNIDDLRELWCAELRITGPRVYDMACRCFQIVPNVETGIRFFADYREDDDFEYFLLKHPDPKPYRYSDDFDVNYLKEVMKGQREDTRDREPLAPYFSCVVAPVNEGSPCVYVLGQDITGEGTTLRVVSKPKPLASDSESTESEASFSFMNANLGPGPPPDGDAFVDAVLEQVRPSQDEEEPDEPEEPEEPEEPLSDREVKKLTKVYSRWSTAELKHAVTHDKGRIRSGAIDLMKAELERRGE